MKDKYGIERFHDEHLIPIKYRHYFKNEIKHTNIQEWSKDLKIIYKGQQQKKNTTLITHL